MLDLNYAERDYSSMTMAQAVAAVIRDAKVMGTVTMPLRTTGYHTCCNLMAATGELIDLGDMIWQDKTAAPEPVFEPEIAVAAEPEPDP